jgi:hypothetical protein
MAVAKRNGLQRYQPAGAVRIHRPALPAGLAQMLGFEDPLQALAKAQRIRESTVIVVAAHTTVDGRNDVASPLSGSYR